MLNGDEALREFGNRIGLSGLTLEGGACALTVGDGLEIAFEATEQPNELRLNGQVGSLPAADPETLRDLLVANHNGQATGAGALSIDPRTGTVVLGRLIDVTHLDAAGFAETVEAFLKYLVFWTGHLPETARRQQGAPSSPADGVMLRA